MEKLHCVLKHGWLRKGSESVVRMVKSGVGRETGQCFLLTLQLFPDFSLLLYCEELEFPSEGRNLSFL